MGELILCKKPIAATPYYMEEVSCNLYSLEELSYYICQNVYLLHSNFATNELCHWIGRELGYHSLEHQLLELITKGAPLHIFVGCILSASGYLTPQEMKEVLALIASFENKSEEECKKMRGDRLLEKQRVIDAIYEYEHLINEVGFTKINPSIQGDVWHNLGTAYARLFFFQQAKECFLKAYEKNGKQLSLWSAMYAMRCGKDEQGFEDVVFRYQVSKDVVDTIKHQVTELSQKQEIKDFKLKIDEIIESSESVAEKQEVKTIVEQWKQEYGFISSDKTLATANGS